LLLLHAWVALSLCRPGPTPSIMPQADEWNRVKKVLDQEREALSTWGYDCSHSSNVWSAFHLVGEPDPPEKNPDRCNARTYFRKVCALPELFVLSAFAAQRSLIKTFKREPDFVADEALKWYAEVVHPPILSGFSDGFFAGARMYSLSQIARN
jgi:hypothetical protein